MQEIADRPAWKTGWRFGSLAYEPAEIKGIRTGGHILAVKTGLPDLRVELDGHLLLATNVPVIVSDFRLEKQEVECCIDFNDPACQAVLASLPAGLQLTIQAGYVEAAPWSPKEP